MRFSASKWIKTRVVNLLEADIGSFFDPAPGALKLRPIVAPFSSIVSLKLSDIVVATSQDITLSKTISVGNNELFYVPGTDDYGFNLPLQGHGYLFSCANSTGNFTVYGFALTGNVDTVLYATSLIEPTLSDLPSLGGIYAPPTWLIFTLGTFMQ